MPLSRYDETPFAVVNGVVSYSLRPVPKQLPRTTDRYYTVRAGDNWPRIAWVVYGEETLWWVLADANAVLDPFEDPKPGTLLRVPARPRGAV